MTLIAEFTIDAEEFLLGEVLTHESVTALEMERVVPTSRRLMPYVWVHAEDLDQFQSSIQTSDQVKDVTRIDAIDESALYRITWEDDVESLIDGIAQTNAVILEARRKEQWFFRFRFDTHGHLADFHHFCRRQNIDILLERIYDSTDDHFTNRFGLTEAQRKSLVLANRDGYFEVPRRTTLGEIGDELGVTEQSVSESLRRGADKVLKQVMLGQSATEFVE